MAESKGLSFRLDAELSERLHKLAENTQNSPSSLVLEAVHQFLALNEWHLEASRKVALAAHGSASMKVKAQPMEDLPLAG
jgi:predicted transcriptional regulator